MRRRSFGFVLPYVVCVLSVLAGVTTNLVAEDGRWSWLFFGLALASTVGAMMLGRRGPSSVVSATELAAVAAELGGEVRRQWQREADRRGLATPDAIRLPLAYVTGPITALPQEIMGRPKSRLPKPRDVTEIGELYRALPSGRLVIVGGHEAGKTAALAILASRQVQDRPSLVPFSLARWDPLRRSLEEWLAQDLAGQYPELVLPDVARLLIERRHVVPLLDGLDELPGVDQVKAVEALRGEVWDRPFVLTSTKVAYADAVGTLGAPLPRAAVVELGAVTGALAVPYLAASRFVDAAKWKPVASLLATPLMVYLARKVYDVPGGEPGELLRLQDQRAVAEHLLGAYLTAAYRDDGPRPGWLRAPYTAAKADAWLGYLARLLRRTGATDIAWWRLEAVTGTGVRLWTAAAAFAVATGVVPVLLLGDLLGHVGSVLVLCVGGLIGAAAGLQTMHMPAGEPYGTPPGHRLRDLGGTARSWGLGLYGLVAIGIVVAVLRVMGEPKPLTEATQRPLVAYPLLAVLMGGWVFGLDAFRHRLGRRVDDGRRGRAGSAQLLAADRWVTLADALVVTCMTGALIGAFAAGLADIAPGNPAIGSAFLRGWLVGLGYGTAYALFGRAWGRWLIYARLPMLLGRRQPARLLTFWEDAHRRGVLRKAGAAYQFRHAHLLDYLAGQHPVRRRVEGRAPRMSDTRDAARHV